MQKHNSKTSNGEVPIDKVNIEILGIYKNLEDIARFNISAGLTYLC